MKIENKYNFLWAALKVESGNNKMEADSIETFSLHSHF